MEQSSSYDKETIRHQFDRKCKLALQGEKIDYDCLLYTSPTYQPWIISKKNIPSTKRPLQHQHLPSADC